MDTFSAMDMIGYPCFQLGSQGSLCHTTWTHQPSQEKSQ